VLARADQLGIEPVLLGTVPEPDLPSLVAHADAFAFPSVKEGFGLAAMEALAAGTPVVARDLPVVREVFGDAVRYAADVTGIAAQLERVLESGTGGAEAGRALAASYSWDAAAAQHERFYAAVLERGGDGGAPIDLADPR
jgi:glycosyltransferase involved in cell wall biosynthesis